MSHKISHLAVPIPEEILLGGYILRLVHNKLTDSMLDLVRRREDAMMDSNGNETMRRRQAAEAAYL